MILPFEKPDRICIVDRDGKIVKLNDRDKTVLRFDASERKRARRILANLNGGWRQALTGPGPYRMLPLLGSMPEQGGTHGA
jgi:hypothetical protein